MSAPQLPSPPPRPELRLWPQLSPASIAFFLALLLLFAISPVAHADPYPPLWQGGSGPAVHYQPVAWPNEPADPLQCGAQCGGWRPYTRYQSGVDDPRTQDPSNGGTRPQNYVNIASSCIDQNLPSIYYYVDTANDVLMFRWRVEQVAATYALGPSAGAYGATDPWSSGLWTVFFDVDGNGYRDFAAHLNGSSGDPSTPIDRLVGIWGDVPNNQSLDYTSDPNIHVLGHNPTGFIDQNKVLNFHSSLTPDTVWPNGSAERLWNYGPTRQILVTNDPCTEYFVDYQIPMKMFDASALGGPRLDRDTPLSMLFCTANSLNNPFQKDCAYQGPWTADPNKPAPFGDYMTLNAGVIAQPIVDLLAASGCGPTRLTANVKDTLDIVNEQAVTSITGVGFYYYADLNGDGIANDGGEWSLAANATRSSLNQWSATWNNTTVPKGAYIIGVQAVDNGAKNASGKAHRTFSYLTQAQVDALTPPANEVWYANPAVTGAKMTLLDTNTCGPPPPYLTKSVNPTTVPAGGNVDFTVTVHNTAPTALTVSTVTDLLPAGFSYVSTGAGTLGAPSATPAVGATGNVEWTFAPAASVPANSTRTLVFTAKSASLVGTYTNTASASTSAGEIQSDPAQVGVGAPRLTINKTSVPGSVAPSDTVTFNITYSNDSPVNVSNAVVTDVIPVGLSNVIPANGGTYNSSTRTLTWNVPYLAAGDGPYTVSFTATVDTPYPDTAPIPLPNTATITSPDTSPASATSNTYVNAPRPNLTLDKQANTGTVAPGGLVVFTINYRNVGNAAATQVVLTDPVPAGWTFVSATGGGTHSGGVVTWNVGTVAAGGSGSATLTLAAGNPYSGATPAVNTATIDSLQTNPVSASTNVGVNATAQVCSRYYFHQATTNVGFDGTRQVANLTAPTSSTHVNQTVTVTSGYTEFARFYSDPAMANTLSYSGNITTTFYADINTGGVKANVRLTVYDYDPSSGTRTQLGQQVFAMQKNTGTTFSFATALNGVLPKGHRLLWLFEQQGLQANDVGKPFYFWYDSATNNSNSYFCTAAPPNLVIDKRVSASTASAGSNLSYTVVVANTGATPSTNTVVEDTLPAGVTFQGATLNGAAITPTNPSAGVYRFTVNSAGQAAGVVAGGASATLVVNVRIDAPLAPAITTLLNTARVESNETPPVSDTATTAIVSPKLSIAKSASPTLLNPGDVVTYELAVLNSGQATANNVQVKDTLPAQSYFVYVPGSAQLNGTAVSPDPVSGNQLTVNIPTLAAGASAKVTFQMRVAATGAPSGVTTIDNTGTAQSTEQGVTQSNVATVSISTLPNLRLTKSVSPSAPTTPGSLLTYTLVVTNDGAADATAVKVFDPIPANTVYEPGTLTYEGAAQTDMADGDQGQFEAVNNRVLFNVGTLPAGASRALTFKARVALPLPSGTTPINNTGAAGGSNTATKQAVANTSATAAPTLTLDKTGPATVAYPAARATAASTGTTLTVNETSQLAVGQSIRVNGQTRLITAIDGAQVTVDAAATVAVGDAIAASFTYSLAYANTGTAVATVAVLQDTLPAGVTFVSATGGGSQKDGVITWNLGALNPGDRGLVQVVVIPDAAGSYVNNASFDSDETAPVTDAVTTVAGGLRVRKSTTTPVVIQTLTGATASYTIEVENTLPTAANGVVINDTLASGFTYQSTTSITGGARSPATPNPAPGDAAPSWGTFSIPGNGTLTLTYVANVGPTVGPATYQNFLFVTSTNQKVTQFDPLDTTAEDVEVRVPVVVLRKTVTPTSAVIGQTVEYTIVARNIGRTAAKGVVLTDDLPSDFAYFGPVSITATGATRVSVSDPTAGTNTPSWGAWDIEPNGEVTIVFRSTVGTTTGAFPNTVTGTGANTLIPPLTDVAPVTVSAASVISGAVWDDLNGDGKHDAGEPGIPNVEIRLSDGQVALTDANGAYTFAVLPGAYTITEVNSVGYISTGDKDDGNLDRIAVTVGVEETSSGNDFLDVRPASVSGSVFDDLDGNGQQDAGEPGLSGVVVTLKDSAGNTIATTTNGLGYYEFADLKPGDYTVVETQPGGYISTGDADGGDPDQIGAFTLAKGQNLGNQDFGEQAYGSISGVVCEDANANGACESGESGIAGVTVTLSNGQTATTDGDGAYTITAVPPGAYTITETQPGGYISSSPDDLPVTMSSGQSVAGVNFAEVTPLPNTYSISGTVCADKDGDGVCGAGEASLPGVTVKLYDASGAIVAAIVTDANGVYRFPNIPPGIYNVVETDPDNYASVNDAVGANDNAIPVTVASADVASLDFIDAPLTGSISGVVYEDLNLNGQRDAGEPGIAGVTVTLSNGETQMTDSNGAYAFANVAPGPYTLTESDPSGYVSAGDVDGANDNKIVATVTPGAALTGQDFGDAQTGTISGKVWVDPNYNGAIDGGERGLSGVTVCAQPVGAGTLTCVTTDAKGDYTFGSLPPGDYIITETDPAGYTSTTANSAPISLPPNGSAVVNFGDVANNPALGSIGGAACADQNGNGICGDAAGETPLAGVTVELYQGETLLRTVITDAYGHYLFDNLVPGAYNVREVNPTGYTSVTDADGATNGTDKIDPITVSGADITGQDFVDAPTPLTISGQVCDDLSGDGICQEDEPGLEGVTVTLYHADGNLQTAVTDSQGLYSFTGLQPGSYTLIEADPAGYVSTGDVFGLNDNVVKVRLIAGSPVSEQNFADRVRPGAVSGAVWDDLNGNGRFDPGETGVPGVEVCAASVSGGNAVCVNTDQMGRYLFRDLSPDDYIITETTPAGYESTGDTDGANDDTIAVTVTSGTHSRGNDFFDQRIVMRDLGDLPDTFGTTGGSNGARHALSSDLYLGACVDGESSVTPGPEATSDDTTVGSQTYGACAVAGNDEDGVTLVTPLIPGQEACVAVSARNATGAAAILQGWIDWDSNGSFSAGEALTFTSAGGGAVASGGVTNQRYCFIVPGAVSFDADPAGAIYMRFRLSSAGNLTFNGGAADGEVEDYRTPLACASSVVWHDANADGIQDSGEQPIGASTTVRLVWAGPNGTIETAEADATASGDDVVYATSAVAGQAQFCGLIAGPYQLKADPPSGYPYVTNQNAAGSTDVNDSDGYAPGGGNTISVAAAFEIGDLADPKLPTSENGLGDGSPVNSYPDNQEDRTWDFGFLSAPLAVNLASLTAQLSAQGVVIAWETVSEADNAGFNVYRSDAATGPWTKLNEALIASQAPGSVEGRSYQWLDGATPYDQTRYYLLEAIGLDGSSEQHGPAQVAARGPNAVRLSDLAAQPAQPPLGAVMAASLALLAGPAILKRRRK